MLSSCRYRSPLSLVPQISFCFNNMDAQYKSHLWCSWYASPALIIFFHSKGLSSIHLVKMFAYFAKVHSRHLSFPAFGYRKRIQLIFFWSQSASTAYWPTLRSRKAIFLSLSSFSLLLLSINIFVHPFKNSLFHVLCWLAEAPYSLAISACVLRPWSNSKTIWNFSCGVRVLRFFAIVVI